jgi:polysaccharide pyruvyl transferase WcaK-like protein
VPNGSIGFKDRAVTGVKTVLIDPGSYDCLNFGDLAMLQVALARWRALWPSASIGVLTEAPAALESLDHRLIPLSNRARAQWLNIHVFGRLHSRLPSTAAATVERFERGLALNAARPLEAALAVRHRLRGEELAPVTEFLRWMRTADVVALTGGGSLTDAFTTKALRIMDTLQIGIQRARRFGKPVTAIFGQGFGPFDAPVLRSRVAAVLPSIDFIALREGRASSALLRDFGVQTDRIFLTGDDAIELAYGEKKPELGGGLGINVRVAYYAETNGSNLGIVKQAAHAAARRWSAPLVPLPISRQPGGTQPHNAERADAAAIRELFADVMSASSDPEPRSPVDVIRQVGRCRVVVTGSYHGAVFALSQGIPAVGLVASEYYRAKFLGLADQFGAGLETVEMSESGWGAHLEAAIARAWESAEAVRPVLLEAATRQIELSRQAYRTVAEMADGRSTRMAGATARARSRESRVLSP